jgi:hypothetical protein
VANAAVRAEGYRETARQFVVRLPLRLSVTQLDIAVVGGTYLAGF